MAGRRCPRCNRRALHRVPRRRWQRALSYLLPIRPYRCEACAAHPWRAVSSADERLPWLTSSLAVGALIGLAGYGAAPLFERDAGAEQRLTLRLDSQLKAAPAAERPSPAAAPVAEPPATRAVRPQLTATPALATLTDAMPAAAPEPSATPASNTDETPAVEPAARAMLRFDVRRVGEIMEIRIAIRGGMPQYRVSEYAAVHGYIVDLPGLWELPAGVRTSRSFTRTPLQTLRIGRHPDYLRLVLGIRGSAPQAPQIEVSGDELVIRVI